MIVLHVLRAYCHPLDDGPNFPIAIHHQFFAAVFVNTLLEKDTRTVCLTFVKRTRLVYAKKKLNNLQKENLKAIMGDIDYTCGMMMGKL